MGRFFFLSTFPLMEKYEKIKAKRTPPALPRSQAVLTNQCLSVASYRRRKGKRQAALKEPLCFLAFTLVGLTFWISRSRSKKQVNFLFLAYSRLWPAPRLGFSHKLPVIS